LIEAIVSDLGNVLLKFDNGIFFRAMTKFTSRTAEEIRAVTHENIDLLTLFEKGVISPFDFYKNATDLLEVTASYEDFYKAYSDVFAVILSVRDLFRRLKPRHRMILLSNTDVVRWTFIKSKFPEILFFDGYVLSFDIGAMKPQPEIYLEAIREGGAKPERTVFIDDLPENVAGAERMGMKGIVLGDGVDLAAELRKLGVEG
jgi:HAD superfamily hydrolase (TIGR01509 family)